MSRRRLFIDTDVLIYAMQDDQAKEADPRIRRAKQLLEDARAEQAETIISAITAAEFLGGVKPELRAAYEQALVGGFRIVPFNQAAIRHAARIQYERFPADRRPAGMSRSVLKADIQILGCVLAQKPDQFVTADPDFLKLAGPYFGATTNLPALRREQLELGLQTAKPQADPSCSASPAPDPAATVPPPAAAPAAAEPDVADTGKRVPPAS